MYLLSGSCIHQRCVFLLCRKVVSTSQKLSVFHKEVLSVRAASRRPRLLPVDEIPKHVTDLPRRQPIPVPFRHIAIDPHRIDILAQPGITHQDTGFFPLKPLGDTRLAGANALAIAEISKLNRWELRMTGSISSMLSFTLPNLKHQSVAYPWSPAYADAHNSFGSRCDYNDGYN